MPIWRAVVSDFEYLCLPIWKLVEGQDCLPPEQRIAVLFQISAKQYASISPPYPKCNCVVGPIWTGNPGW